MSIHLSSEENKNKEDASDQRISKGACKPNPSPPCLQARGEIVSDSFLGKIK